MFKKLRILMDAAGDGGSPSGNGSTTPPAGTPPNSTPPTPGANGGTPNDPPATPPATPPNQGGTPDDQSKQTPPAGSEELKLDLKGLEADKVADIMEFAKAHKLTAPQAQAMVDQRKANSDADVKYAEDMVKQRDAIYVKWENELKTDKDFGGQAYDYNIKMNEKFIGEHMPGLGKLLTDSGKKLPPMLMKEVNSVARKLYGETEFVDGNIVPKQAQARNPWDHYGPEQNSK